MANPQESVSEKPYVAEHPAEILFEKINDLKSNTDKFKVGTSPWAKIVLHADQDLYGIMEVYPGQTLEEYVEDFKKTGHMKDLIESGDISIEGEAGEKLNQILREYIQNFM